MNALQWMGHIISEADFYERILLIGGIVCVLVLLGYCLFLLYSKFA